MYNKYKCPFVKLCLRQVNDILLPMLSMFLQFQVPGSITPQCLIEHMVSVCVANQISLKFERSLSLLLKSQLSIVSDTQLNLDFPLNQ